MGILLGLCLDSFSSPLRGELSPSTTPHNCGTKKLQKTQILTVKDVIRTVSEALGFMPRVFESGPITNYFLSLGFEFEINRV